MIKKIIILVEANFTERDYKRFGIELLKSRSFLVEVWSISRILNPEYDRKYSYNDFYFHGFKKFNDLKQISKEMQGMEGNEIFLCIIGIGYKYRRIYRLLTKYNCKYGYALLNAIPSYKVKKIFCSYIKAVFRSEKLLNFLYLRLPNRFRRIKKPSFVLLGGEAAQDNSRHIKNPSDNEVWCHTLDYDIYLSDKVDVEHRVSPNEYAVFLDEFVPFHPDYILADFPVDCTKDLYYPNVNRFFNHIEKLLGIEIIIAAHPRSNYEEHPDYFDSRRTLRGDTVNLVKHAKLVIAHASTAINFAILYHKPVIFLTQDSYSERYRCQIRSMAQCLNKNPVNLSGEFPMSIEEELSINDKIYDSYKHSYIKKSGTPEKPVFDIFADFLETF